MAFSSKPRIDDASSDRELRDRLEAVQVELRDARARISALEDAVAEARSHAETSLARAEAAEHQLRALQRALHAGIAAKSRTRRADGGAFSVIALLRPPEDFEVAVSLLATVTNLSPYDVRMRLRTPPPITLVRAPHANAVEMCQALRENGLPAVSAPVRPDLDHAVRVRRFQLLPDALLVHGDSGDSLPVRYDELDLLVRGCRISVVRDWDNLAVAELPVTAPEPPIRPRGEREDFLWLYARPEVRVLFEDRVDFRGLGDLMAPAQTTCLQVLLEQLSGRAPHALVDDRLLRIPRFHLLGVTGEQSAQVLAELLWAGIRERW